MGRKRKPDGEKLVPVTVCLTPSRYDQFVKAALEQDIKVSALLRSLLSGRKKTDLPVMAPTSAQ